MSTTFIRRATGLGTGVATIVAAALLGAAPASSTGLVDSDGDGMPDRWERAHGLRVHHRDAGLDPDHDALKNGKEFLRHALPHDEDSDNDGHDDGDEVFDHRPSTDVDDADTNDDGTEDGDEDADHDEVDNEDEDDADENCRFDDDDRDEDSVDDKDENELGTAVRNPDSDSDGIEDGNEDQDEDGEANEDEDDSDLDDCDGDVDEDGEADEDGDDRLGVITSFDDASGQLVITADAEYVLAFQVTGETEVEWEDHSGPGGGDATQDDLDPGVVVVEVEIDDDEGTVEQIEIAPAA